VKCGRAEIEIGSRGVEDERDGGAVPAELRTLETLSKTLWSMQSLLRRDQSLQRKSSRSDCR
jgi:hypothetical protein